ncbi:MAG: riboflavin biosynthesis protein RibF [Candidatus Omnitrophica bacterium]|nr:riboflavin biosynthesis protein RibF [Candidatus Omnitrophota bacterium]
MKIFHGIENIGRLKKPVAALGVFDGVHCGHIKILKGAVKQARKIKGTSVAVTFWPHPQKEGSLYSLEHRLRLIAKLGIQASVVINLNPHLRKLSAGDFIKNILVKRFGVKYIYVGKNFKFGKGARGDVKLLNRLSREYGFKVKAFGVVKVNHEPVSSTLIRALIRTGKLKEAQRLLTRPVSVLGTVIKGSSVARKLGYPTANIDPHHEVTPPPGIYAVTVIYNNKKLYGACYIGRKPTFGISKEKHIEVHIFDFKKNIYSEFLEIRFVKKIRDDKKFSDTSVLAENIKKDMISIRSLFMPSH